MDIGTDMRELPERRGWEETQMGQTSHSFSTRQQCLMGDLSLHPPKTSLQEKPCFSHFIDEDTEAAGIGCTCATSQPRG